ncbi:MAG TPA: hypothetical protein VMW21_00985 [Patescibacteria group bacterium]|nr:hypothetical protein [Patescibacteria group bacterium]
MAKKTRTIVFLICLLAFVLIAPATALYSQGYRIDFNPPAGGIKISQTGGLFLKVVPKQVEVFLDGKLNKKTDFFFGSVFIENLLPQKYKVEIKKEGYHSWEKTLEVKEKEVAEAKNVVLFPRDVSFNLLFDNLEQFWLFPDGKKIILMEQDGTDWTLETYDLDKKTKNHLINNEDFTRQVRLAGLDFSEDSKTIYLEINSGKETEYFSLTELDKAEPSLSETKPLLPAAENIVAYQEDGSDIYYLDKAGHLFKNGERLSAAASPFAPIQETEYNLEIFRNFIFLRDKEKNNLYKFNDDLAVFEIFFENAKTLEVSPDNEKLAYFSNYEIWLFLPKNGNKGITEKIFLTRLSEKINNVSWINSDYLMLTTEDKIKICETDNRDRLNIIDVFEIKKLPSNGSPAKIIWDQSDKKIYVLSGNGLYDSNILLP